MSPTRPIGIAEVIVDGRILGLELDGVLELLDRPFHVHRQVRGLLVRSNRHGPKK
jgi:hypothetical protein